MLQALHCRPQVHTAVRLLRPVPESAKAGRPGTLRPYSESETRCQMRCIQIDRFARARRGGDARVPVCGAGRAQPDDPCHVDRDGDRSERRGRAGRDRQRDQHRHEHQHRREDQPGGHLHVHGPATRRVHRRSGGHRLQAQRPDRHHPADCGNIAAGYPARSRRGDRGGQRRQPGTAGPEHVERAGAGHRLQADSVAAAQRSALSAAHHADARVRSLRGLPTSPRIPPEPARAAPSTTA